MKYPLPGLFGALVLTVAGPVAGLEFKVCTLVQARVVAWPEVPAAARIDRGRLSFKRKAFLESRPTITVWAPAVKRAVAAALKGLTSAERVQTTKVMNALGAWVTESLEETPAPWSCPVAWRTATQVLEEGRGNVFELVRALTAMLRSAGIPAKPTFNGVPMVSVYVTPPAKRGFWTVWDPWHPDAALRRLPVLWLPLRAGEVPLVRTEPETLACQPSIEGRRFASREHAQRAFAFLKSAGRFADEPEEFLEAGIKNWWEVWAIGARVTSSGGKGFSAVVPLPFVKDVGYGTREHGVWVSASGRLQRVARAHAETDQKLGGLVLTLKVYLKPAQPSATLTDA